MFAKLYSMTHVRADRWYKLGPDLLYGRLEDEVPFQNVRRLVEYEDYVLRLLRDAGHPDRRAATASSRSRPSASTCSSPNSSTGAVEIGDAEVDDDVIDQGLLIIRRLWDAGLAHRDIKPANLLVQDGQVFLIDVAFVQVRPSPWRQAVDLANMMLVLAVRTDADRVYERALRASPRTRSPRRSPPPRGVASPTQLRSEMKQDGRGLLAEFRSLAPSRPPISLQRWSPRRVLLFLAIVLVAFFVVGQVFGLLSPAHDVPVQNTADCGTNVRPSSWPSRSRRPSCCRASRPCRPAGRSAASTSGGGGRRSP